MDITHEFLLQKIKNDADEFNLIAKALNHHLTAFELIIRMAYSCFVINSLLSSIKKFEKLNCMNCDAGCSLQIKDRLATTRDSMYELGHKLRKGYWFPFASKYFENSADKMDDMVESYTLASDPEIKTLLSDLTAKVNQKYAVR